MAKKRENLDEMIQIPLTKTMKREIVQEAEREERQLGPMGRRLLREALDARKIGDSPAGELVGEGAK